MDPSLATFLGGNEMGEEVEEERERREREEVSVSVRWWSIIGR